MKRGHSSSLSLSLILSIMSQFSTIDTVPSTPIVGYCEPIVDCITALRGLQSDINKYKETNARLLYTKNEIAGALQEARRIMKERYERIVVLEARIQALEQKEQKPVTPLPETVHWWSGTEKVSDEELSPVPPHSESCHLSPEDYKTYILPMLTEGHVMSGVNTVATHAPPAE
jgi:hypothetical protein